ncbi:MULTISPECIES: Tll0287-like domain-containing protein [Maricaulis]|uniref:Protein-histidine pros-kinase n=1 Tax=Maricaulis maris TaxID=74318 RepID=A0A495DKD1_9PROT|nr:MULTISPECIES: DUF3365 domain-containing protein [Maricaulis]RKR03065.1 protein-histidine pros-kinase [Maricaulis maris]
MTTSSLIRRALALVFLTALVIGGSGAFFALQARAFDEATRESRLLLATAQAIRAYTSDQVAPLAYTASSDTFHPETVPSFAAQTVFAEVSSADLAYTYREVALNPTSPTDRPVPFETELINAFRQDDALTERSGRWRRGGHELFYLARPIRIEQEACLSCHSTPDQAPPAMVERYGTENGFGWQMGETIGLQIVTVPIEQEMRGMFELVLALGTGLLVIFLAGYAATSNTINRQLVVPLQALTARAEDVSVGIDDGTPLPDDGASELKRLSASIERLRRSLRRALADRNDHEGQA